MCDSDLQTDDAVLFKAYQNGDTAAFELLYQRHKLGVYRYFFRQVNNPAIAEELHQDVWMKIIKGSGQFEFNSSFKTWLYRIAHNRLVDYFRSNKNAKIVSQYNPSDTPNKDTLEQASLSTETGADISSNIDPNPQPKQLAEPEFQLYQEQTRNAVFSAIAELPMEQKEAFLLHQNAGLSVPQIAEVTQVSKENSKSRLRYAIDKLRSKLSHYYAQS